VLDRQFAELHEELFSDYDCRQCCNCCRNNGVTLGDGEAEAISTQLGITEDAFVEKYCTSSNGEYALKAPCHFLNENGECSIQGFKPQLCKDYPHTNKPHRGEHLLSILSDVEECPIVFEILERLKKAYKFR
jgi:Fe-S-cluster containining protein